MDLSEWFIAAKQGDVSVLTRLLTSTSQNVEETTFPRFTALHLAAQQGNTEACEYLLRNGALVNTQDHHGRTALHKAVESGNKDLCVLLIDQGANLHARNEYGRSPIEWAQTGEMKAFLQSYDKPAGCPESSPVVN